ncbi:tigger transposable element-derived protein 4-like [Stegodyphus dumicola]|uniref:tigger transposable element-derived protein 4-like n=1 Tax=Stegodyphus dumicola TaxID=202533 RepID=UPI0015AF412B|nr:tigger transposable element-derived protein 4-like [Stegodyphus dumicola]XP_035225359.1 tigger transposable element-derived protein 4-like [Stegodyphus dumicola]
MSGTDKRKLLVIGKSTKPRCIKGLRMDSLPVVYQANRNAWMTSELFKEWLKDWNRELQHQSRKVLLLLGNCAAHPHLDCLTNIQLKFLPPRIHSFGPDNEHGHHQKFEDPLSCKLG